jgi:hypothetical protein
MTASDLVSTLHTAAKDAAKTVSPNDYHLQYFSRRDIEGLCELHKAIISSFVEPEDVVLNVGSGVGIFEYMCNTLEVDCLGIDKHDAFFEEVRKNIGVESQIVPSIFKPAFSINTDKTFDSIFLIRFPFVLQGKISQETLLERLLPYKKPDGKIYMCNPYPEVIG